MSGYLLAIHVIVITLLVMKLNGGILPPQTSNACTCVF